MNDIKTKETLEHSIKKARVADKLKRVSDRTAEHMQKATDDQSSSSSEYASDRLEYGIETVTTEAGHLVVDTGKLAVRAGKKTIQEARRRKQSQEQNTADSQPDSVHERLPEQTKPAPEVPKQVDSNVAPKPRQMPVKADGGAAVKSAERSVKTAQRTIKTAETSSATAVKTAQTSVKTAEKTAETTAKAAVKAKQIAQAAAEATARGLKAAAEATVKAVKAIVAAIKELVAAIAAGGWVAVAVIVVILLVALLVGSSFGIFFAGEDTGSPMTMQSVIMEINRSYTDKIESIENSIAHDELETTGDQALWPDVLAVYAVKVNTDPTNATEVVTMNDDKKAILEDIFWDMNKIKHRTTSRTEITYEEVLDEEGNLVTVEVPITIVTLHIETSGKTADEMAVEYSFTDEQKTWLSELQKPEYDELWSAVLYGIHNADEQIVAVALSQVGNVGGRPYWSWYGFNSRVAWCACFVSWCADQCGYIDAGIIPKFAGCVYGGNWFIQRGQWADRNYVPQPGDIIFFDWYENGRQDGVRDHVGIVEKVENGYVYTIEGNSGDKCKQRRYPIGWYEINGYGLPAYP